MTKTHVVSGARRAAMLEAARQTKMARSAHAFVRGNTAQFYEWLADAGKMPEGPAIWICGDCHLGNLGPLADADGRVDVQIRDLDQAVIGNPAHDLIRLGLSLASAARGSDLPGVTTALMVEEMVRGYRAALEDRRRPGAVPEPAAVKSVRRRALGRRWRDLARERIRDVTPNIPVGQKFWPLRSPERRAIERLFENAAIRRLVAHLNGRKGKSRIDVLDAAYWMKGCSSLGRLRYAVLVEIKDGHRGGDLAMIDLKEAVRSAAPAAKGVSLPRHQGERVVAGARALSPNLGERITAANLMGRPIILRELMPQDLKIEVDQFTRQEAVVAAKYLSFVVGRAHARQMDRNVRRSWRRELDRHHSRRLDAPGWLWTTVVGLLARHEEAYLEHCRRYSRTLAA